MFIGHPTANKSVFFPPNPYPIVTQRERTIADQINNYKTQKLNATGIYYPGPQSFANYSSLQSKEQLLSPLVPVVQATPQLKTSLVQPGAPTVIESNRFSVVPTLIIPEQQTIIPQSQIYDFNSQNDLINSQPLVPIVTPTYQQLFDNQTMGVQMSMMNKDPSILQNDPMMRLRDSVISKLDGVQDQQYDLYYTPIQPFQPLPRQNYEMGLGFQRAQGNVLHSKSSHIGSNISILKNNQRGYVSPAVQQIIQTPKTTKPRGIGVITQSLQYLNPNNSAQRRSYQQSSGQSNRNSFQSGRTIAEQFHNIKQQQQQQQLIAPQQNYRKRKQVSFQIGSPEPSEKYAKLVPQVPVIPPRIMQIIKAYKSKQKTSNIQNVNYQRGTSLGPYYIPSKHAYYLGQWINGLPYGFGKVIYDSNAYFQGFFVNGQAQCEEGLWIYPDSSYYIGGISKSEPEGLGKMIYQDFELVYEGEWVGGKPNGKGKQIFKDGSRFDGYFIDGVKNGEGQFVWADGSSYHGHFRDGFMQGKGSKTDPNGSTYVGDFNKNLFSGKGLQITNKGQYDGQFVLNKKQGQGKFVYTNGDILYGTFDNDSPNGKGKLVMVNGQTIEGIWINGVNVKVQKTYPTNHNPLKF